MNKDRMWLYAFTYPGGKSSGLTPGRSRRAVARWIRKDNPQAKSFRLRCKRKKYR